MIERRGREEYRSFGHSLRSEADGRRRRGLVALNQNLDGVRRDVAGQGIHGERLFAGGHLREGERSVGPGMRRRQ